MRGVLSPPLFCGLLLGVLNRGHPGLNANDLSLDQGEGVRVAVLVRGLGPQTISLGLQWGLQGTRTQIATLWAGEFYCCPHRCLSFFTLSQALSFPLSPRSLQFCSVPTLQSSAFYLSPPSLLTTPLLLIPPPHPSFSCHPLLYSLLLSSPLLSSPPPLRSPPSSRLFVAVPPEPPTVPCLLFLRWPWGGWWG